MAHRQCPFIGKVATHAIGIDSPSQARNPPMQMPRSALTAVLRFARQATVLAAAVALVGLTPPARSQAVTSSSAPTPNERLMSLVPEKIGAWVLDSLRGARPGPDGVTDPAAEAEFHKKDQRISLSVSDAGARRVSPPATPVERETSEGVERIYAEGNAAVREVHRRVDGRAD